MTILAGVTGQASAQTPIPIPEKDTQNWNEVLLTVPLSKTVDFLLGGSVRIGGNLTKPVDGRWGIGFAYKAHKYLSFSQLLFQREAKAPNGRLEHEKRLTFIGTVRIPIGKFTLTNRNGVERRWREPQADSWRYRNRLQLEHPFKVGKKQFTFFISDEPSMTSACAIGCATERRLAPGTPSTNISRASFTTCGRMTGAVVRAIFT
jgi:hypothetical protein